VDTFLCLPKHRDYVSSQEPTCFEKKKFCGAWWFSLPIISTSSSSVINNARLCLISVLLFSLIRCAAHYYVLSSSRFHSSILLSILRLIFFSSRVNHLSLNACFSLRSTPCDGSERNCATKCVRTGKNKHNEMKILQSILCGSYTRHHPLNLHQQTTMIIMYWDFVVEAKLQTLRRSFQRWVEMWTSKNDLLIIYWVEMLLSPEHDEARSKVCNWQFIDVCNWQQFATTQILFFHLADVGDACCTRSEVLRGTP
jgi:hypothetical protein